MRNLKVLLLSFLTFVLFSFSSSSQEILPDSLTALIESKTLIDKMSGWHKATAFYFDQKDSINYKKALNKFNQLPFHELNENEKRTIVETHSDFLKNSFQYNTAKRYLLAAIQVVKEANDFNNKALFHQILAPHYFYSFQYDSCDIHLDKAIALYTSLGNNKEVGELTIRKSGTSYAKGNYEDAIEYSYKAIEIFKETGNQENIPIAYLQLGNIFYFLTNFSESKQYYELSYTSFKKNNDEQGMYRALSNIGLVNLKLKNYEKSIRQQLESIVFFKAQNKELEKGNAYRFLSAGYFGIENYDSAKYFNNLSIESNLLTKYAIGISQGYLLNSKILKKQGNLTKSLEVAKRSYALADSVQHFETLKEISEHISSLYSDLNNTDSSYKYLKIYTNLNDSLDLNPEKLRNYAMKHQFQVEEAQFEVLLANEKAQIQLELNAKKQTQLMVAVIVAICSLLLLALAIVILLRNKALSKQLTEKQNEIKSQLEIKESLLSEIHHRVKNNLQVISSMLSLQTQYISDDRIQKVIDDCRSRINSMSLIHESLYKKTDGVEAPFSEYIMTLIPQLIETYQIDKTKIKANMKLEEIHLDLDESIPCGLLMNEIISNALKHAFPNGGTGIINVNLSKKEGFIRLQISDNGIGFKVKAALEEQESFGFLLIDTLAKQLEAEIDCVNENGVKYDIKWRSIS